jgi:hypothetical protein
VLDDTQKVADIKQKVLNFLNVSQAFGKMMQILGVDYSISCAEKVHIISFFSYYFIDSIAYVDK